MKHVKLFTKFDKILVFDDTWIEKKSSRFANYLRFSTRIENKLDSTLVKSQISSFSTFLMNWSIWIYRRITIKYFIEDRLSCSMQYFGVVCLNQAQAKLLKIWLRNVSYFICMLAQFTFHHTRLCRSHLMHFETQIFSFSFFFFFFCCISHLMFRRTLNANRTKIFLVFSWLDEEENVNEKLTIFAVKYIILSMSRYINNVFQFNILI